MIKPLILALTFFLMSGFVCSQENSREAENKPHLTLNTQDEPFDAEEFGCPESGEEEQAIFEERKKTIPVDSDKNPQIKRFRETFLKNELIAKESNELPVLKKPQQKTDTTQNNSADKFHWKSAIVESLYFLGIQQSLRMMQKKTRREINGPFFRDWATSVKNLGKWRDGDSTFTNYVAHPMQGAVTSRIFINNSEKSRKQEVGKSKDYWKSRAKALAWSTVWSAQFELGPISEASIGNVGLYDRVGPNRMGWVDLVITPTAGTAVVVGEDMIDKYILKNWLEKNRPRWKIRLLRMFITPFQAFTNVLHGKLPWKRYSRH